MIIPMLCVTIFVRLVVWFLLPRVAMLMIHTPTAISIFVCLSMVQLMAVFFFLMIPLPPQYTLFPYTTLFRSPRGGRVGVVVHPRSDRADEGPLLHAPRGLPRAHPAGHRRRDDPAAPGRGVLCGRGSG